MTDDRFRLVGVRPQSPAAPVRRAPWYRGKPIFSAAVLTLIVLGCLFCEVLLTHDPTYLDLAHCNEAPSLPARRAFYSCRSRYRPPCR